MKNTTIDLSTGGLVKSALYPLLVILTQAWYSIPNDILMIYIILILIDVLTGVIKAITLDGLKVKSKLLNVGIISKVLTLIIPLVLVLMFKSLNLESKFLISSVLSILCLSEGYSILGNIYSIRTKQDVEEFDSITYLLTWARCILKKLLLKFMKNLEE